MTVTNVSVALVTGDIGTTNPLLEAPNGAVVRIFKDDVIRWVQTGGAAGNKATLLHGAKQAVIYDSVSNLANWTDWHKCPKDYLDGLFLSVLAVGTLYILRAEGRQT